MRRTRFGREDGVTLIEVMATVMFIGIITAIAAVQVGPVRHAYAGDGALRTVMAELNTAREMALAQRRLMEIRFAGGNRLQVIRHEVPDGVTVVRDVFFESGIRYALIPWLPDTPDAYGKASATSFGPAASIEFDTDGALVDAAGVPINGTVFVALPDLALSARAITIQGTTGRVRGYRWDGRQWQRV